MNKNKLKDLYISIFCFITTIGLILALTWPWALHFQGEFLSHWDPPFHAWKLEFMARRILAGDWFISSTNTNMLYPFSGTLYYEALQWPQALFAAFLFKFTSFPSELIYHITLIFFWALSAPCMYFLLRQLDCSKMSSFIGSLIFCILPHRISYMVEFQMEMIFAMPLFFAFVYRFFRKYNIIDGLLVAFSWWLFAVSELYQAIFVVMAIPFIAIAFLKKNPNILKEKKFWLSAGCAIALGVALLFIMLIPYLQQHSEGAVMRPLEEVRKHSAQPFTWLVPYGRYFLWYFNAKVDEFSMYPTIPVLILFATACIMWIVKVCNERHSLKILYILSLSLLISVLGYFGLCLLIQFTKLPYKEYLWDGVTFFSYSLLVCSFLLSIFHKKNESYRVVFLKGFLVASILFFLLSLGPLISLGVEREVEASHSNRVYLLCYRNLLPFLSGFRVVSRFGVLVLFFMIIVSTVFLDQIHKKLWIGKRKGVFIALAVIVLGGVVVEAVPVKSWVSKYKKIDNPRNSPAIDRFIAKHPICTLAICPSGPRTIEGPRMFSLLKGDWPYVYAWGGYFPPYSQELVNKINSIKVQELHYELNKFFPEAILILDKANLEPVKKKYQNNDEYKKWFIEGSCILDFERLYSSIADVVDSDEKFTIFKLKPYQRQAEASKIFRSDVARKNPNLSCSFTSAPNTVLLIKFNEQVIAELKTDDQGNANFKYRLTTEKLEKASFNTFLVDAEGDNLVDILNFSLLSDEGYYDDVMKPYLEQTRK